MPLNEVEESSLAALRDVALFVAVKEAGGFAAAARRLGVPASTLSWRINALEETLGVRLFHRTTRKVTLTTEGATHYERCKALTSDAQALLQDIRGGSRAVRGRLRISTTIDFSTAFLAPILPTFLRRYPDVKVELEATAQRVDLLAENLDLAIRMGPLPDSGLVVRRLFVAHINLFAAPAYLRSNGMPVLPSDLNGHVCLKAGAEPGDINWNLRRGTEVQQLKLIPRFYANHLSIVRHLAINGLGIAALVEELYRDDINSGRLERVLPAWSLASVAVSAVIPQQRVPAPHARVPGLSRRVSVQRKREFLLSSLQSLIDRALSARDLTAIYPHWHPLQASRFHDVGMPPEIRRSAFRHDFRCQNAAG